MILAEVEYERPYGGYKLRYTCHSCGKVVPDNRFVHCPYCGVEFVKYGHPEHLDLNQGDICGLIALAIISGGFGEKGVEFINKGKYQRYEGPGTMGEMYAGWKKPAEKGGAT